MSSSPRSRSPLSRALHTLTGFIALGGVRWLLSVMADRTPSRPEDLTLEDVLPEGVRHITIAGHPVAIRERGEGDPAVMFIHGFAEDTTSWREVQDQVARTHRTIALDLWGFGASARPPDLTQPQWVDQVTGVMDALGLERAVLAGHSLGGRASLMCARRRPDRVAGLVLADADFGQAPHGYLILWLVAQTPALPWVMGKVRSNPGHIERVARLIETPNYRMNEERLEALHRPIRVKGTAQCWRSLGQGAPLRPVRRLPEQVSCPARVIWGGDDPLVPLWAGQKLSRKLQCPLEVIEQCGHFPQEEYPRLVADQVSEFVVQQCVDATT